MCEAGRILHHLANSASDSRNTILIVGFQGQGTLGRNIVDRRERIRVFGDELPLRARVEVLNGYSAHGDRTELQRWLQGVTGDGQESRPPVWLVHGEPPAQEALSQQLRGHGYDVHCPAPGDRAFL